MRHSPERAAFRTILALTTLIFLQNLVRSFLAKVSFPETLKLSFRQIWKSPVAFAALTQNYFLAGNRSYDGIFFAAVALAFYAVIFLLQRP